MGGATKQVVLPPSNLLVGYMQWRALVVCPIDRSAVATATATARPGAGLWMDVRSVGLVGCRLVGRSSFVGYRPSDATDRDAARSLDRPRPRNAANATIQPTQPTRDPNQRTNQRDPRTRNERTGTPGARAGPGGRPAAVGGCRGRPTSEVGRPRRQAGAQAGWELAGRGGAGRAVPPQHNTLKKSRTAEFYILSEKT